LFSGNFPEIPRDPTRIRVVSTLISACPWSAPLEDKNGTNAVEYAILSDSSIEVVRVRLLHHAIQRQCEKQSQKVMPLKTSKELTLPL
jgi:hypothetical protein